MNKRLYFFTMYNISPIQAGIQSGHAALKYMAKYCRYDSQHPMWNWIETDGTWIILNGGTSNQDNLGPNYGTLNQLQDQLVNMEIEHDVFYEPDLNDALSAICLFVDEKIFDWKVYPPRHEWQKAVNLVNSKPLNASEIQEKMAEYDSYEDFIGGTQNAFLKDLIWGKKLA